MVVSSIKGDEFESLESLESGQLSCGRQHILFTFDSIVNNAISYPNHVLPYVFLYRKYMGIGEINNCIISKCKNHAF